MPVALSALRVRPGRSCSTWSAPGSRSRAPWSTGGFGGSRLAGQVRVAAGLGGRRRARRGRRGGGRRRRWPRGPRRRRLAARRRRCRCAARRRRRRGLPGRRARRRRWRAGRRWRWRARGPRRRRRRSGTGARWRGGGADASGVLHGILHGSGRERRTGAGPVSGQAPRARTVVRGWWTAQGKRPARPGGRAVTRGSARRHRTGERGHRGAVEAGEQPRGGKVLHEDGTPSDTAYRVS